jgi:hypothetical protein
MGPNPTPVLEFRTGLRYGELPRLSGVTTTTQENTMGLGKGALLWLVGIPLPIIILLVLFWR